MISKHFRDELTSDEWKFMIATTLLFCFVCAFLPDTFKIGHLSGRLLVGIGGLWSLWALVAGQKPKLLVDGVVKRLEAIKETTLVQASRKDVFKACSGRVKAIKEIDVTYMDEESGLICAKGKTSKLTIRLTQESDGILVKVISKPTKGLLFATDDKGKNYKLVKNIIGFLNLINSFKVDDPQFTNVSLLTKLTHNKKIEYSLEDLKKRGMNKLQVAPPVFKLFWKLGLDTPPPVFQSFQVNSLMFTAIFSAFYLLQVTPIVALCIVHHEASVSTIVTIAAIMVLLQSIFFGAICAGYLLWKSRKMNLPKWEEYDPTTSLGFSGSYQKFDINDDQKLAA